MPELHIDRAAIDAEYRELTGGLSDLDREQLSKTAARTAVLLKTPERVERICADIAKHFQEKVGPNGFGAQVVTCDRESCVLYKRALDRVLQAETSDVVMTVNSGEDEYAVYRRDRDAEERLLDRFRDPNDPLKVLIVTSKLLTGFDAPILQTMYLDKPLRDHALLQAICRTENVNNGFPIPFVKAGIISGHVMGPPRRIYLDAHGNPGFSGAPLILSPRDQPIAFTVAGVITASLRDPITREHAGFVGAIGIQDALELISASPVGAPVPARGQRLA